MIKVGIVGAVSQTAQRLITLLLHHPDVDLRWVCCHWQLTLSQSMPHLMGETELSTTTNPDWDEVDVVIVESALEIPVERLREVNSIGDLKVIDLSDPSVMADDSYVCGLPELNRKYMVRGCNHVVCPTPLLQLLTLPLLPLAQNLMLTTDIHATVLSSNNAPEDWEMAIQQAEVLIASLQNSFGHNILVNAMPHNLNRGMIASFNIECNTPIEMIRETYEKYFDDHNFTFVVNSCQVADVLNTNKCLLELSRQGNRLVVNAFIDDQVKGRAGTAVHVMNLLFGLQERVGLML